MVSKVKCLKSCDFENNRGNKISKHVLSKILVNWLHLAGVRVTVNLITNYLLEMQLLLGIINCLNFGLS